MNKIAQSLRGARAARWLAVVALGALALVGSRASFAAGAPTDTITVSSPNNTTVAESDDYATQLWGNPWDMNDADDTHFLGNFTPPTIANGIWSAQATQQGASINLVQQGIPGTYQYVGEHGGVNYPIDAHRFSHLRIRMYSSVADHILVVWFPAYAFNGGNSNFVNTQPGWHVYDVDLTATGSGSGGTPWLGQASWSGLQIDPIFNMGHAGANIQIDWVRLTPATGTTVGINWTATGSNPINLYLSTSPGGANEMQIAANLPANTRSYNWSTMGLAAGTYYIHAVMGTASSYSGALIVNQAPVFNLTAPSPTSGEDFATTVLGAPWTMTNLAQMQAWYNLSNITFNPGYMQASSPVVNRGADPQIWFLSGDTAHMIDTSRYHYMSYRFYIQAPNTSTNGQYPQENLGPRPLWAQATNGWTVGKVYEGWYNRWMQVTDDLRAVPFEPGYQNLGWTGWVQTFRFDPFEEDGYAQSGIVPPFFRIGDVRLTADPSATTGGTTMISWTPLKTSGNITFYYNTSRAPGGTPIATVPLSSGGYVWSLNGVPNGTYWVSAVGGDGLNTFWQLALAPLVVRGSHACPSTYTDVPTSQPFHNYISDLSCRNVVAGYSDNSFRPNSIATRATLSEWIVRVRGWAINTAGGPHFADVPPSDPAYPFVETAYNHGVISGYADGTFRPDVSVTRGQLSKMVVNAFGWAINTSGGPHFSDVPTANVFYAQIETLYNHGLISGYGDGTFRWGNPLTRGQLTKILDLAH